MQDFDRSAHGADHAAADDALGQFEVVKAEQVNAFVKIQQTLGDVVQPEKFRMAAIEFVHGEVELAQLGVEGFAEAGTDVQQSEEAGRVEAAAVSQAGANQVVVVGRDGLQFM